MKKEKRQFSFDSPMAAEDTPWEFNGADYTLEQLARSCAWVRGMDDPHTSAIPEDLTKADCKLPHHRPDGTLVLRALRAAAGALMGARGGVDIPEADEPKVRAHIARHMSKFGVKAPWEQQESSVKFSDSYERRSGGAELRADGQEGEALTISGHAAVFNTASDPIMGRFIEKVMPGAFKKTINEGDVRALINHDPNLVLGRTKNKTLELKEDDRGLFFNVKIPDTQWAQDFHKLVKRGDITQASFGFRVIRDAWENGAGPKGMDVRMLQEVELFDVSPVTFPAYPDTVVVARSAVDRLKRVEHGTKVQTLIMSKERFETKDDAVAWAKENGFSVDEIVEKGETWHVTQFDSVLCMTGTFATINITDGVQAVICQQKMTADEGNSKILIMRKKLRVAEAALV